MNSMRLIFLIGLSLFFSVLKKDAKAQNEANIWIVGDDFGIDFNFKKFSVFDRSTFAEEGTSDVGGASASICNASTGELLFYTEGRNVWNSDFRIMPNGGEIIGTTRFGATQSVLILPYPDKQEWYFLFSARSSNDSIVYNEATENYETVPTGLYYSLIDMQLDGGKGDVIASNKNMLLQDSNSNLITAVPKPNSNSYWLITCEYVESRFAIYPVTPDGIGAPKYSDFGFLYEEASFSGCVKPSPDGSKLVFLAGNKSKPNEDPTILNAVTLYDLDPINGAVSNGRVLGEYPNTISASFSPDNTKLYVSHFRESDSPIYSIFPPLLQFDLETGSLEDIIASETSIEWDIASQVNIPIPSLALQLAPDGRLYNAGYAYTRNDQEDWQRVIFYLDNPNLKGNATQPGFRFLNSPNNVSTDNEVDYSPDLLFPNFPQSYFNELEPIDNFITTGECDSAEFTLVLNPVEDFASIVADNESCLLPATVKVYNSLGQLLNETRIINQMTQLDFKNYAAGLYFLVIEANFKASTFKVIKR